MEGTIIEFVMTSLSAVGTFLLSITAVIGVVRYLRNASIANEVLYKDEAEERFKQLQNKLSKLPCRKLEPIEYGGSDALIIPRLDIRKISWNSRTIGKEWKGARAILKYYQKNENGKVTVNRWLL